MERNNRRFDDMKTGTQRMYIHSTKGNHCGYIDFKATIRGTRELTLSIGTNSVADMTSIRNLEFEIIDSLKAKGFTVDRPQLHLRK